MALAEALPIMIPHKITKAFLINNNLDDEAISGIIIILSNCGGFKSLNIAKNGIGSLSLQMMAQTMVPSLMFRTIRKFILKDPFPQKVYKNEAYQLTQSIRENASQIYQLNKLVLCKIGLGNEAIVEIGHAVKKLQSL